MPAAPAAPASLIPPSVSTIHSLLCIARPILSLLLLLLLDDLENLLRHSQILDLQGRMSAVRKWNHQWI